ncbi:hypothetical protein [Glutamicibacter sp. TV12E]|uniref:hypothetical protein n=1 Tax=Glutamicibacter sp. TV12E TaxID=3446362 RepID=UPI00403441B3
MLRLIDGLPSASRFQAAILKDPEIARILVEQDTGGEYAPPLEEYDAHLVALSAIHDRLGDVAQAVLSSIPVDKGKSTPKYRGKPYARPHTAVEDIREEMAREAGQMLINWFTPHAAEHVAAE